jgi:hypothetical protein
MGIGRRWRAGIFSILLAQTASAAEGFTTPRPPAHAARTGTPASSRSGPPEERWYGWQILISDASSLVLAGFAGPLGAAGYLVAPPLIHVSHGQGMRALASVGLRIGLPLAGAAIAIVGTDSCSNGELEFCDVGWIAVGVLVGLSGMGVDIAFANEPIHPPKPVASRLLPQLRVSEREVRVGLLGSF